MLGMYVPENRGTHRDRSVVSDAQLAHDEQHPETVIPARPRPPGLLT